MGILPRGATGRPHPTVCRKADRVRGLPAVNSTRPLDNFPLLRSRKVEELQEAFARVYAKPVVIPTRAAEGVDVILNNCRLHDTELAYFTLDGSVKFDFPGADAFAVLMPLSGNGEFHCGKNTCELNIGSSVVVSANTAHQAIYHGGHELLVLRVKAKALTEKLAALIGAAVDSPLRLSERMVRREPAAQMLRQYVPQLAATLSQSQPPLPEWWAVETEQLLMLLLLCGYEHNYSHLLELDSADAAPWQVRKAEEYIAANAGQAITLEELADVVGMSGLSLFRTFKKSRGYSPLEFLAQARARRGGRS
jgi:hypothetical protein